MDYSGISDAQVGGNRGAWDRPGSYIYQIEGVEEFTSRKKEEAIYIRKKVIHVFDDQAGEGHSVGDAVTHALWQKHVDTFLGNVKGFIMAAVGCPEKEVNAEAVEAILDEDQPLAGTFVHCENYETETKSGNPFTVVQYKRRVSAAEVKDLINADTEARLFPNGLLDRLVKEEAAESVA